MPKPKSKPAVPPLRQDRFRDRIREFRTVRAGDITIEGRGAETAILSSARPGSSGQAGSIDVVATGMLSVRNSGVISSDTFTAGRAKLPGVTARTM